MAVSGILGRPVKPGDDTECMFNLDMPPRGKCLD
jgi:hypothetical protein